MRDTTSKHTPEIVISILLLWIMLLCHPADGQTYGGITYSTTTNFLAVINTTNQYSTGNNGTNIYTNTFSFIPPSKSITIQGYTTNETFVGSMYLQVPGYLFTNIPNSSWSNLIYIGSFTNQFTGSPGNWTTNTVPTPVSLPFPLVLNCQLGSNNVFGIGISNSIFVP